MCFGVKILNFVFFGVNKSEIIAWFWFQLKMGPVSTNWQTSCMKYYSAICKVSFLQLKFSLHQLHHAGFYNWVEPVSPKILLKFLLTILITSFYNWVEPMAHQRRPPLPCSALSTIHCMGLNCGKQSWGCFDIKLVVLSLNWSYFKHSCPLPHSVFHWTGHCTYKCTDHRTAPR